MSSTKAAKDALEQAYTSFEFNKTALSKTVKSDNINERTLQNRMDKMEESLTLLNSCHTSWVSKADFSDEQLLAEKYSGVWLRNIWSEVAELQDLFDTQLSLLHPHIEQPLAPNTKQQHQIHMTQMDTLQKDISTKVKGVVVADHW